MKRDNNNRKDERKVEDKRYKEKLCWYAHTAKKRNLDKRRISGRRERTTDDIVVVCTIVIY